MVGEGKTLLDPGARALPPLSADEQESRRIPNAIYLGGQRDPQDVSLSNRHRPLNLGRPQTPSFSIVACRPAN
jgi:hypothetical protein